MVVLARWKAIRDKDLYVNAWHLHSLLRTPNVHTFMHTQYIDWLFGVEYKAPGEALQYIVIVTVEKLFKTLEGHDLATFIWCNDF